MRKNVIRFYTLPDVYQIEIAHGVNVTHAFPRHIHDSFSIGMIERGERVLDIRGAEFTIATGECFFIHPHEPHACQTSVDAPHAYWILSIAPAAMQTIVAEVTGTSQTLPHFAPPVIQDRELFDMIANFVEDVQQDGDGLKQTTILLNIVSHCLSHYAHAKEGLPEIEPSHQAVQRAREYLEQHFARPIKLEELADAAHLSPFHLNRIFQREIGIPPYEYLVRIRLKRAQELLDHGEMLSSAAYSVGFADQSHFTRFFKKHIGMTPGEYRRLKGENDKEKA